MLDLVNGESHQWFYQLTWSELKGNSQPVVKGIDMHMTSFNLEFVFSVLVLYQVKIIKFSIKCHCYDHKTSQQCKVI